jgi:hypothetical protein
VLCRRRVAVALVIIIVQDRVNGAVWLLAVESASPRTDASPHFKRLDAAGQPSPGEDDYELIFRM